MGWFLPNYVYCLNDATRPLKRNTNVISGVYLPFRVVPLALARLNSLDSAYDAFSQIKIRCLNDMTNTLKHSRNMITGTDSTLHI